MAYNEIYKILLFRKTKLITTKLMRPPKIMKLSSLVVRCNVEPKLYKYVHHKFSKCKCHLKDEPQRLNFKY